MSLDTTKSIKSITYNGTEIPLDIKPEQEKTVTPTASGVVVTPDTDYTLSKVTVNGDSNLTAGNIKSGIKIFGVTGTLESGEGSSSSDETWVMNETIARNTKLGTQTISFISNSESYTKMVFGLFNRSLLSYGSKVVYSSSSGGWNSPNYRKITFATPPTGDLLTWLQANGVKQTFDTAIQPSKSLTVTSNGTTTITPDVPYDAIGQVDLTVNVASGGGNTITALTIKCSDENGYGLPLLITYQTNNGEMRQAYNGETMNTDSGPITFQDVLIGGICIISIPTETTTWIVTSLHNIDVNVTNIYMDNAVGSEELNKTLAYKITGANAEINLRLLAS